MGFYRYVLRNKLTGKIVTFDANARNRFKKALKKIINFYRYNNRPYYVAHVVLTVAENVSFVKKVHLNRFFNQLRKHFYFFKNELGLDDVFFKYTWTKQWQKRGAIHFHVLLFCSEYGLFPAHLQIQNWWELGYVWVNFLRSSNKSLNSLVQYISRYMSREMDYESNARGRLWSSSFVEAIYSLSYERYKWVVDKCSPILYALSVKGRKLYIRLVEYPYRYLLKEFPTDWELVERYAIDSS